MSYTKLVDKDPYTWQRKWERPQDIKDYDERFRAQIDVPSEDNLWEDTDAWFEQCWLWTGATQSDGQSFIQVYGRKIPIHRFSWLLWKGEVVEGMYARPMKCRNMLCVCPYHLELVRRRAMLERKLNKVDMETICFLYRDKETLKHGWTHEKIAQKYKVSQRTIRRVLEGDYDLPVNMLSTGKKWRAEYSSFQKPLTSVQKQK